MVDAMANTQEDLLIDGLQFKLPPGASYVSDRRTISYFTAGSNVYQSGSGTKIIRIQLNGDGWLDPGSVRLHFTLVNNDPALSGRFLRTLGGPWSFFRRVRCLIGGALIDDIDYYNRVHEMMHICTSTNNRDNDDTEGFGYRWDSKDIYNAFTATTLPGIPPNTSINACFKPMTGLLSQQKCIPLMWCPIVFEFEIVSGATDAIVSPATVPSGADETTIPFKTNNTSTNWQIQDVRMIADVLTLDSGLQNSYAQHVLGGGMLPINYSTYVSILQSVAFPNVNVSVTRSVSRLKTVFFNFDTDHTTLVSTDRLTSILKDWNSFQHAMSGAYDNNYEMEYQMQIGSKMFPEYPCRSVNQAFYELKKALGIASSSFHSISPTRYQYQNDHFILAVDTEKIIEAGFTGLNTKAGDLMSIRCKNANGLPSGVPYFNATRMYVMLHTDNILEIRETGCQVFD